MNQDIIKMAQEAGAGLHDGFDTVYCAFNQKDLERFFHMAQQDMKERCAKVVEGYDEENYSMLQQSELAEAIRAIGDKP